MEAKDLGKGGICYTPSIVENTKHRGFLWFWLISSSIWDGNFDIVWSRWRGIYRGLERSMSSASLQGGQMPIWSLTHRPPGLASRSWLYFTNISWRWLFPRQFFIPLAASTF